MTQRVILVMGVAGSGKSTVGRALAEALDVEFLDADDFHSAANVARMAAGIPLDDDARRPWLENVHAAIAGMAAAGDGRVVVACSALKQAYRDVLLAGFADTAVVHLDVDRATLEARLRSRREHFMPVSLLDDQLATLEKPTGAITWDPAWEIGALVARLRRRPEAP